MTAANKKFQQLKRKVHAIDAWKHLQDKEDVVEKGSVFTGEQICKHCGFKARYQFVRCPECNREQK